MPTLNQIAIEYIDGRIAETDIQGLVHNAIKEYGTPTLKQIDTLVKSAYNELMEADMKTSEPTIKGRNVEPGHIIKVTSNDVESKVVNAFVHGTSILIETPGGFTFGIKPDQDVILIGKGAVAKAADDTEDDDEEYPATPKFDKLFARPSAFTKPADKYSASEMRAALVKAKFPVGARGRLSPEQKAKATEILDAQ